MSVKENNTPTRKKIVVNTELKTLEQNSLWNPEVTKAVVDDYQAGKKLRAIEEKYGITRSIIYRILRNADVAPTRVKQKSRDEHGDTEQTTTMLFRIVEQQNKRIHQLEEFIESNDLKCPAK